jgi:hypothetical protein
MGFERSAIGTVVERTTRFTMLIHLPREEGYRHKHSVKNSPALAGYGTIATKNTLASTMSILPRRLTRSLSWDRGKEMSAHAQFKSRDRGAPTCPGGAPRRSLTHSTPGPAKHSAGRPPPKHLTNTYYYSNKPVLLPPVESSQNTPPLTFPVSARKIASTLASGEPDVLGQCRRRIVLRFAENEPSATSCHSSGGTGWRSSQTTNSSTDSR